MSYTQDQYAYLMHAQQQSMYFNQPQMTYQTFHGHPTIMVPHAYGPYFDHPERGFYADFDESTENTTRPRLTKEQVAALEAQFAENPKPNSGMKRSLANVTGLHLPRVANWFQNRRAKAKQQRKQEEFEEAQKESGADTEKPKEDVKDEEDSEEEEDQKESTSQETTVTRQSSTTGTTRPTTTRSPQRAHPAPEMRAAAQASMARALAQAEEARQQRAQQAYVQQVMTLNAHPQMAVPLVTPQQAPISVPIMTDLPATVPSQPSQSLWNPDATHSWVTQQSAHGNMGFDFGFDSAEPQVLPRQDPVVTPGESASQVYETPEAWTHPMTTPTMTNSSKYQIADAPSDSNMMPNQFPMVMSSHVGQKRPSVDISQNLEGVDIGPPATQITSAASVSSGTSDGADLASRRNRPRPAALSLGPGALRSRSYGQLSAASPTYRSGMTPPAGQSLRQSKSTGHGLNSHYAGIRKSSLPHKSPLQITFREAEYKRLMEAQAAQRQLGSTSTEVPQEQVNIPYRIMNKPPSTFNSPPTTPYNQQFFAQTQTQAQPTAIQQQYASVSETPPYSAGPMTATSWDWNSVTSPELAQFPQTTLMSSLPFSSCAEDSNMSSWSGEFDQSQLYNLGTPGLQGQDFMFHELDKSEESKTPGAKNFAFENRGQRDFAY